MKPSTKSLQAELQQATVVLCCLDSENVCTCNLVLGIAQLCRHTCSLDIRYHANIIDVLS